MDFTPSPTAQRLRQQVLDFVQRYLLPHNPAWHQSVAQGVYPPPFLDDLQALAREQGLWNLFLPDLPAHAPGQGLSNLDYAWVAEPMGRLPWAAEVFNCSAPDSGNMELLHRFGTPAQQQRWLTPLFEGRMRSAFAMSEPDVASSDPTNLHTVLHQEGDDVVLHGRKWFVSGAAHPRCQLLIVVAREDEGSAAAPNAHAHARHSLVLVPMDSPGVQVLRNIPILQHHSPEGHCEIRLQNVRLPATARLGAPGEGFALAQARGLITEQRLAVIYLQLADEAQKLGMPYGPGLVSFGFDPEALILVRPANMAELLWAVEEAIACRAVAAVVADIGGHSKLLDFTASRRLSMRAASTGGSIFLLRYGEDREASAAHLRWCLSPAPSAQRRYDAKAPGPLRWRAQLERGTLIKQTEWLLGWTENGFSAIAARGRTDRFVSGTPLPRALPAHLADRLPETA